MRDSRLKSGEEATLTRTITEQDIRTFARLTGDENPIHVDANYARQTRFGRPVAHGLLVAGLISAALGTKLPGEGSIYLSQSLSFLAPVYAGDTVVARVRIEEVDGRKGIIRLDTEVVNGSGTRVISGEARLLCPRAKD